MKLRAGLLGVCAACASAHAEAETLGRLFFTPEQRALFDRQRQEGRDGGTSAIRLDGLATRSGKPLAFWINGRAYSGSDFVAAGLRVGESIDPVSRGKTDVIPNGSLEPSKPR